MPAALSRSLSFFSTFLAASTGLWSVFRKTVVDAMPAFALLGKFLFCSSFYLWGRIHGRLSSECDKWNCVINLASRFNVLRDAQRLLSSPCTSIRICQRNVQENRDIHPSLSVFFPPPSCYSLSQPCLISGLSYRVVMGASPGRGLAPARAAGGINLLSLKCWKLCKCQTRSSDVLAEGRRGWRGGGKLWGRVCGWAIQWFWSPVALRSWRLPGADVAACSMPLKN